MTKSTATGDTYADTKRAIKKMVSKKDMAPEPIRAQAGPQTQFLSSPADIVIFGGAAFGGKRLSVNTSIPTPDGWKAMGELKDGDKVLDDNGLPCTVTKAHPITIEDEAYRMTFDDGQVIYAGADHLWKTLTKKDLGTTNHGQVRTTRQILKTLRTRGGKSNHYILNAKPLFLEPKASDTSLYDLGREVVICFGQYQDRELAIDRSYLRGSLEQRLALLQGMMDVGGLACIDGSLKFITTCPSLSTIVEELVHSLGSKTRKYSRGGRFYLKWSSEIPMFRAERKYDAQDLKPNASARIRAIVSCKRAKTMAMRCITVDSPSRLYLAGRGMIPTHNTFSLLMEGGRHIDNPAFTFTVFRRSIPQITNQGALWDESFELYPALGGMPSIGSHSWKFPSGAEGKFAHLQEEKTIYDYDGAQIPLIAFDQLEQFTEKQFFYMMSRNRSGCGVKPYMRASANPPKDRGHWLRSLVDWWIGEDGYPIKERSGVIRYFTRDGNMIVWVDKDWRDAQGECPQSFTFIGATYSDNKIGLKKDPGYVSKLNMQDRVDKQRLKDGNWNAFDDGVMFKRDDFKIVDRAPPGMKLIRYWDRAATEKKESNDPDWTAGSLCGEDSGALYIVDMEHFQDNPLGNEQRIAGCAEIDGPDVEIHMEEEGGSAGKDVVSYYQRKVLRGYIVHGDRPTGDKRARAKPWCALSQNGNVYLVRGTWNHKFLAEVETFPNGKRDQVDSVSGAYKHLLGDARTTIEDLVSE